jgi:hypothetical protein
MQEGEVRGLCRAASARGGQLLRRVALRADRVDSSAHRGGKSLSPMSPAQSIKLSLVCGAVLGTSIVCSTAFAQSPSPTPCVTPAPNAFATPTPAPLNTTPFPPPGVQEGGVAVPVPVLNMGQYLPGGRNFGADQTFPSSSTIFRRSLMMRSRNWPSGNRTRRALLW